MATLIIHPQDRSTTFLDSIYEKIADKTVIQGGVTKDEIIEAIMQHDRVIMLGHGGPNGLFSLGRFSKTFGHIIDKEVVPVLKEKNNSIFIWCNANMFVEKYELEGFYSGMFISEVSEAKFCKVQADQNAVTESNYSFSYILSDAVDDPDMYATVMKKYGALAKKNRVAAYNFDRLYHQLEKSNHR